MNRGTSFASRLAILLAALLVFATLFVALLNYLKFERLLLAQQARVFQAIAVDVAETFERGVNIGVRLPGVPGAQALIERAWDNDADLRRMSVVDSSWRILFDTDRARIGAEADRRLMPAPGAGARPAPWHVRGDDMAWVAAPIANGFGQHEGTLLLGYTRTAVDARLDAIALAMLRPALLVIGLIVPVVVLLAFVVAAPVRRHFAALTGAVAGDAGSAPACVLEDSIRATTDILDEAERELEDLMTRVPETTP